MEVRMEESGMAKVADKNYLGIGEIAATFQGESNSAFVAISLTLAADRPYVRPTVITPSVPTD